MTPDSNRMIEPPVTPSAASAEPDVASLLRRAGIELRIFGEVKRRLQKQAAPDFSIFEFLRSDELGLSTCFASLLDPKGSHGQGATFLARFLEQGQISQNWRDDLDQAEVFVESQANGMRRIDICIRLPGNRWIGIENKPWAVDQEHQLRDYGMHLQDCAASGQWVLVYLGDRDPPESSLPPALRTAWSESGNFKHMKFTAAVEWLRRCEMETRPQSVRHFLHELGKFVSREVSGEVEMERGEILKQYVLESDDTLRAALVVAKGMGEVKQQLLQAGLQEPYERLIGEAGLTLVWKDMADMVAYAGFGARLPEHPEWNLRYEFERSNLGGLFWGLKRKAKSPEGDPNDKKVSDAMKTLGFGAGKSGPWWAWYSVDCTHFGITNSMRNWQSSEAPWLMLRRPPQLAEKFANHTLKVAAGLRTGLAAAAA